MNISKLVLALVFASFASLSRAQIVEYIHTDALGSPIAVTNSSGAVIERTVYEPYGAVINRPITNGPGYTGHVLDAVTGLNYMQQRYYDPQLGRFISVDAVTADSNGGNFNSYWYAANNPYRLIDPDGRWPSQKGFYVHQDSIERALGPQVSRASLEILKSSQVIADGKQYQTGDTAFRHAMRSGNMTVAEARRLANSFVRQQFQKARDAPTLKQALTEFGIGLHTIQDATSPAHQGYQVWTGQETWKQVLEHVNKELYDPGKGSLLDEVTREAWELYLSGSLPDGDIIETILSNAQKKLSQPASSGSGFQGVFTVDGAIGSANLAKQMKEQR